MIVTRFGHATVLVETGSVRLLVDPGVYSQTWHSLTGLDGVLVTHGHHDHLDVPNIEVVLARNPGARFITDHVVGSNLAASGAMAVENGDMIEFDSTTVEVVGRMHALVHKRIPRIPNIGFLIRDSNGPVLFHPGDSFETVPAGVDILALPLTAPWSTVGATAGFLSGVAPRLAFPIHDAGASPTGSATFLRLLADLKPEATELLPIPDDAGFDRTIA